MPPRTELVAIDSVTDNSYFAAPDNLAADIGRGTSAASMRLYWPRRSPEDSEHIDLGIGPGVPADSAGLVRGHTPWRHGPPENTRPNQAEGQH